MRRAPGSCYVGEIPGRARGAAWGEDGSILVGSISGLWRLRDGGGDPEQLTRPESGEISHSEPEILPAERAVLYTAGFGVIARIAVVLVETGETRVLIDGQRPQYSPTGHLLYWHDGTLWATRFDADRLEVVGSPVAIRAGVLRAQYALAADGTLVYGQGSPGELVWIDRAGETDPVLAGRGEVHMRVSPDGRRLAAALDSDVWILDLSRHTRERSPSKATMPVLSGPRTANVSRSARTEAGNESSTGRPPTGAVR